jgi:hypothetical protein
VDLKADLEVLVICCFCRESNRGVYTHFLITILSRYVFINEIRFCCFVSAVYHPNEPAEDVSTHAWFALMTNKMQR